MKNSKYLLCFMFCATLAGCSGNEANQDEPESFSQLEILECDDKCSSVTFELNNNTSEVYDVTGDGSDKTNAEINVEVYQDSGSDNFIFLAETAGAGANTSELKATSTRIVFGYDSFPEVDVPYGLVNPALIYNLTNHNEAYIKSIEFSIETNDNQTFSGSVKVADMQIIRVIAPDEFSGDVISDFEFTLLDIATTDGRADLKYLISFSFESDEVKHNFKQIVNIQKDELLSMNLPSQ